MQQQPGFEILGSLSYTFVSICNNRRMFKDSAASLCNTLALFVTNEETLTFYFTSVSFVSNVNFLN